MLELRRVVSWIAIGCALAACGGTASPDGGADAGAPDGGSADGGGSPDSGSDAGGPDDGGIGDAGGDPAAVCDPASLDGLEGGAWDPRFTIPGMLGYDGFVPGVHALARDADGSLLVAGYFVWAGRVRVGGLARRTAEGSWEAVRDDLPADSFSAVAVDADGDLALASFAPLTPDPSAPPQGGRIFADTGSGLSSIGSFEGIVRAIAWVDGQLWVAGHFTMGDGGLAGLAVWDEASGWSTPPGGAVNGPVYALLPEGDSIVVGGSFSLIGGVAARSVAAWNGTSWTALSQDGYAPEPLGVFTGGPIVFGLARDDGGVLHAGGSFWPMSASAGGVARWTGTAWEPVGDGFLMYGGISGDYAGTVSDIAFHDGSLYATGCITSTTGGTSVPNVARWSGTAWEPPPGTMPAVAFSSPWYPGFWVCGAEPSGTAILEVTYERLFSSGDLLYVAGSFPGIGGTISQSLIGHDGERWVAQGETGGLGLAGPASELAVGDPECGVYALAPPVMSGSTDPSVYRFDGEAWEALPGARPEGMICSHLAVSAAGDVYLACETPWTEEEPVPQVYRHDGTGWASLGEIPGVEHGSIWEMRFDPRGRLWIVGGLVGGFVAMYDGASFTTVEDGFDGFVGEIAFDPSGSDAYVVGGGFTHVGDVEVARIARWDGDAWQALGEGFDTPVSAVAYASDAIYASSTPGDPFAGDVQYVLARWDGSTWEELGTPENGLPPHIGAASDGIQHQVDAIFVKGDTLVVSGGIYPEGTGADAGGRNVFVFDGEHFDPLAGGIGAIDVEAIAATPDGLWFGGFLATTGGGAELAPSIGVARFGLTP